MMAESSSSSSSHSMSHRCFREWMKIQEEGQRELLEALNAIEKKGATEESEVELTKLVDKSIEQFHDYIDRRAELAKKDVAGYFAPVWCTARESCLMWIAGCRPSMFIRLVYSVTGLDLEARLVEFLEGRRSVEEVRDVSPQQLEELNRLQMETVKEEERLTSELARVQEEIAEQTVVGIAMRAKEAAAEEELERALEKQVDGEMLRIMEAADKLRMRTLNHLTEILRPLQAVMFLASSKRLHLCVRQWGKRTDQRHGRDAVS